MRNRFVLVLVLFVCAAALGAEETLWQIDLLPTGKTLSKDMPVLKGASYHFHEYPKGTLVMVRKSTVKQITKLTPQQAAAANPMAKVVPIKDLPMQGPKQAVGGGSSGGRRTTVIDRARGATSAANAGTTGRTSSPY